MRYKIRNASPFTVFWIVFYAVAAIGLLVPWDVGQWFAMALAAPMLLATVSIIPLLVVSGALILCRYCLRGSKQRPPEEP